MSHSKTVTTILSNLGVELQSGSLIVTTPVDGSEIARIAVDDTMTANAKIARAAEAFRIWRRVPAPKRGMLIRLLGEELRSVKEPLSQLVTLECGKVINEARGEVQEMIDICDFAVGLSRQLYGLTIASERFNHVMQESWHPLGAVGVISAFNFPVAVWAWNAALAIVCGDSVVWKPSEKTPLTALACEAIFRRAVEAFAIEVGIDAPKGLLEVIIGDATVGNLLVESRDLPLISATGSCRMGGIVGPKIAARFGRALLELGGNNAVIVTPSADLNTALPSILFGAIGTTGQRCTTTRRALVHSSLYERAITQLDEAYRSITSTRLGDPLDDHTLIGPLIDRDAWNGMQGALSQAQREGGDIKRGGIPALTDRFPNAAYVEPALIAMASQTPVVMQEVFAPILYVMPYDTLNEAMQMHNAVAQGLSSAIFTTDMRDAEWFRHHSDCGIVNVNIGTSGAEIGGAFGGEKETGGGRESGSDSWRQYMRRQTSTSYYGREAPELAQGVIFG